MLSRSLLLAVSIALPLSACQGEQVETDTPTSGSGGPVTTGTSGGNGGGGGGQGGEGTSSQGGGGSTADGGGGSTSSQGGATSTSTGAGAGEPDTCGVEGACRGDEPIACTGNSCEQPELFFDCPDGEVPVSYFACVVAEDIYRQNIWGFFVDCLRDGDEAAQCEGGDALVAGCVQEAYDNACPSSIANTACDGANNACAKEGETFPVDACKTDLVVFNQAGIDGYQACISANLGTTPCEEIHDLCLAQLAGG